MHALSNAPPRCPRSSLSEQEIVSYNWGDYMETSVTAKERANRPGTSIDLQDCSDVLGVYLRNWESEALREENVIKWIVRQLKIFKKDKIDLIIFKIITTLIGKLFLILRERELEKKSVTLKRLAFLTGKAPTAVAGIEPFIRRWWCIRVSGSTQNARCILRQQSGASLTNHANSNECRQSYVREIRAQRRHSQGESRILPRD